jgi:hypothetical protein
MCPVITLDQFALNLIRQTVTTERVATVIARIAGDRIEVGPLRFGPGGAVAATGVGLIGSVQVTAHHDAGSGLAQLGQLGFEASIPGDLTIDLTAGSTGRIHRYEGSVVVPMRISIELEAPARVVLAVAPLRPGDVSVRLRTTGMATFVLQTLGDADREVAAQVAKVVNERVDAVADLRQIDMAALLDRAWPGEMADLEARLGQ